VHAQHRDLVRHRRGQELTALPKPALLTSRSTPTATVLTAVMPASIGEVRRQHLDLDALTASADRLAVSSNRPHRVHNTRVNPSQSQSAGEGQHRMPAVGP